MNNNQRQTNQPTKGRKNGFCSVFISHWELKHNLLNIIVSLCNVYARVQIMDNSFLFNHAKISIIIISIRLVIAIAIAIIVVILIIITV